ncbi:MAG: glycoside hydrolase family 32 protein [Maribacter sp.]|nr:glycoside hydrolase family 32 protein [Maribacter sp.]
MRIIQATLILLMILSSCKHKEHKPESLPEMAVIANYNETFRPQFHFSPEEKWMNDPNGLVYNKGIYHLFYQYYPDDIVWGPMHWGHATSADLVHWTHKPIALFPDKNGLIFSGSAVVDKNNTSGFGSLENPPLVAIFTYHDMAKEKEGTDDFQTQGIAYSLDNGDTWTKYEGNPVIRNPGFKDFRDPKVFWNDIANQWTMLLVAGDHLQIWDSKNLREWKKVSEFGKSQGAHGGVWECPDMFRLRVEGSDETKWVLLISINPGAPNGGSGTQYFLGDFDGKTFTSEQNQARWVDWGTDNYAGVTYNNVPSGDRIFIGWMSNWAYARDTPTEKWRSAMTIPRKLSLRKIGDTIDLINYPIQPFDDQLVEEIEKNIVLAPNAKENIVYNTFNQTEVRFLTSSKDFRLHFKNALGEALILSMDATKDVFILDRSKSGKTDFQQDFGASQQMPIPYLSDEKFEVRILMDWSSIEVFINRGQYVMTSLIFPNEPYNALEIENRSQSPQEFTDFTVSNVNRIW